MKRLIAIAATVVGLAVGAHATITLNIDAEALKDNLGIKIPEDSGLVLLIADTGSNGFNIANIVATPGLSLTTGGFFTDDEFIVAKTAVTSGGFGDGTYQQAFSALTLSGNWGQGDPLALIWFPALTTSTALTSGGDYFGVFTNIISSAGGNWYTPPDAATVSMNFFTTDASELGNGLYPAILGNASLQVVPEPSTVFLVGMGLVGAWVVRRRKKA